jgi:hypothetical protein
MRRNTQAKNLCALGLRADSHSQYQCNNPIQEKTAKKNDGKHEFISCDQWTQKLPVTPDQSHLIE